MEAAIEIQAARVLLEKGSGFEIPAPLFYRLIGKKKIQLNIYMPTAATCLEMIDLRLSMNITDEQFESMSIDQGLQLLNKHGVTIAKILAVAILRGERLNGNSFFGISESWLSKKLLIQFPFNELLQKMHEITLGSGLEDFIGFIGLMKTIRLMKPNNPSHQAQRS
ncbi:hypothetical protein [Sphingobacterium cavernae]|uniref:hypothetical protein n=1 Tax=Sphingobacterium cavernae TaxID=2592657 RepID=UPI0012302151|nr:hypothetical protein [Sphingobacterium cavernae]